MISANYSIYEQIPAVFEQYSRRLEELRVESIDRQAKLEGLVRELKIICKFFACARKVYDLTKSADLVEFYYTSRAWNVVAIYAKLYKHFASYSPFFVLERGVFSLNLQSSERIKISHSEAAIESIDAIYFRHEAKIADVIGAVERLIQSHLMATLEKKHGGLCYYKYLQKFQEGGFIKSFEAETGINLLKLKYTSRNKFCVPFDPVWKYMEFSKKFNAVAMLEKFSEKDVDYTVEKINRGYFYTLTFECFYDFCIASRKPKSNIIREYLVQLESKFNEAVNALSFYAKLQKQKKNSEISAAVGTINSLELTVNKLESTMNDWELSFNKSLSEQKQIIQDYRNFSKSSNGLVGSIVPYALNENKISCLKIFWVKNLVDGEQIVILSGRQLQDIDSNPTLKKNVALYGEMEEILFVQGKQTKDIVKNLDELLYGRVNVKFACVKMAANKFIEKFEPKNRKIILVPGTDKITVIEFFQSF